MIRAGCVMTSGGHMSATVNYFKTWLSEYSQTPFYY